ncbi:MAG: hypothetical protein ABGZ35_29890, partial [Planctomycetaceae bacterium]
MATESNSPCLSKKQLAAFSRGLLTKKADQQVLRHLESCAQCEATLAAVEQQPDSLLRQLQSPIPADPYLAEPGLNKAKSAAGIGTAAQPAETAAEQSAAPEQATPKQTPVKPKLPKQAAPKKSSRKRSAAEPRAAESRVESPTPAPRSNKKLVAGLMAASTVALAAIVAVTLWPEAADQQVAKEPDSAVAPVETSDGSGPTDPKTPQDPAIPAGFRQGELNPEDAVRNIRVRLQTGSSGDPLVEAVTLQLGTGFPFRLYPLGSADRSPEVAAYPQKSSLKANEHRLKPGGIATFEFEAQPADNGLDELQTSPALMDGLTVADLSSIGFASRGESDWVLAGYEIQVNDSLFAS